VLEISLIVLNGTDPKVRLRRLVQWLTVEWAFDGEIIEWRGPAPYYFVAMSEPDSAELKEEARDLI
jgi:hypothetical protein